MGVIEYSTLLMLFLYVVISGPKKEKIICVLSMIILFILSALRHESVGSDIVRYIAQYEKNALLDFNSISTLLSDAKDPVYSFTAWLFSHLFKDPQWWLACVAFLFCYSVGKLILSESNKTIISILIIISIGFFSFSLTGLRQTIAMSILLFSYPFIKDRKPIKFIITVIIASLFHATALIFLIIYPISKVKLGIYHIVIAAIAFIVFYAFKGQLLILLGNYLQDERFESYLDGNARQLTMSGFIIQAAIFIFSMYYYKNYTSQDKNAIILYNFAFIGLIFQLFSSFIAEFFRISMYFSIFNSVLVANAMTCEKEKKSQKVVLLVVIFILLMYMLRDGEEYYKFFWQ